ncbi:unnamed protein product [Sphagnum jensenii]|uniref:HMA domain-containing protein n=1 Tax=Sphagnum jensenii TaxID=128206 RepID=A0ABP0W6U9_9BRYO
MFHYGGYGDYHPHPQWMTPPPGFQLVPVQPKKPEKKKQQQVTLKVKMCCSKCEEKVREEIGEVAGVEEVKITDRASSKVVVIGKADSEQVLKKAKKVDKKAKLKEEEEEEKEEEKEEESSTTCSTYPHNCFALIGFVPVAPMEQSGPYRHSQSYGPSSSSYYYPPAPEYYPHCPTWYPYNPWYPY